MTGMWRMQRTGRSEGLSTAADGGSRAGSGDPRTLLFVHAHPDDETFTTGVAIARRAIEGDDVHVLTCTLGDEGEVIPPELAHYAAKRDDTLGAYRRTELEAAAAALGAHVAVLGEDELGRGRARYRDSGMAGMPSARDPRSLAQAPIAAVARDIGAHLERLRPDVVVTYEERGGYNHPDHIRVHHAVCAALARLPEAERPALWAVVTPRSQAVRDRSWAGAHAPAHVGLTFLPEDAPFPSGVVSDDAAPWPVVGSPQALARRDDGLRAHATQVTVGDGWYALSNNVVARLARVEWYAPMDPETGRLEDVDKADIEPGLAP
ncbi:MAG: PIG-L family deacetylase [Dermatophilaceae bacterium]